MHSCFLYGILYIIVCSLWCFYFNNSRLQPLLNDEGSNLPGLNRMTGGL